MAAPFFAVEGGARLKDCPEVFKGYDFVSDVVCFGSDDVFEFGCERTVQ